MRLHAGPIDNSATKSLSSFADFARISRDMTMVERSGSSTYVPGARQCELLSGRLIAHLLRRRGGAYVRWRTEFNALSA